MMEFISVGDLKEQLNEVEFFSEKRATFHAAEISLAVQFLHHRRILLRDLELENVLVDSDGHCKIANFGLSMSLQSRDTMWNAVKYGSRDSNKLAL